jgi:flavin-dependent dehydrogenase
MHLLTAKIDAIIVGAGPAGLASAIAAARQGLSVEVIDTAKPPIDKACGEGLLPHSLESLSALGLDLGHDLDQTESPETESALLRGIRFIGDSSSSNNYPTIQAAFPAHPGRGIRRTTLHRLLLHHAESLGVRFHWENTVRNIATNNKVATLNTNSQTLRARYLIGADGHHSRIATLAGLTAGTTHSRRIGLRQHFVIDPWSRFVELYWSNHGEAYVTPISSSEICVAFVTRKKLASLHHSLSLFPALQRHLVAAQASGPPRGSLTLGRTLRRVTSGNIALIGDASGSVDAITGEGMALCFRQAAALAPALRANNLAAYQQAHRRIQLRPTLMSRSLLLMDRYPRLRDQILNVFQRNPRLFERLLRIHIGHSPCISSELERTTCSNPTTPVRANSTNVLFQKLFHN